MDGILSTLKVCLSFGIGVLGWFLGGFDTMLITLLVFMLVDYITGILNAIANKKLCSSVGFKGLLKKVLIILLVGSINILGIAMEIDGLRYLVISFYLANEGISILENACKLGVPVPEKIKDVLEQLKEGEN